MLSNCRERHEWLEEFEQDWGSVDEWHSEIGSLGCVSPDECLLISLPLSLLLSSCVGVDSSFSLPLHAYLTRVHALTTDSRAHIFLRQRWDRHTVKLALLAPLTTWGILGGQV